MKAMARCASHTNLVSGWSIGFNVTIAGSSGGTAHPFTDVTGVAAQVHDLGVGPDGAVYVLFPAGDGSALAVVKSIDGGVSWGSPVSVPNSAFSNSEYDLAVDPNGKVHVVWWLSGSNGTETYYSRSSNGAASFSPPISACGAETITAGIERTTPPNRWWPPTAPATSSWPTALTLRMDPGTSSGITFGYRKAPMAARPSSRNSRSTRYRARRSDRLGSAPPRRISTYSTSTKPTTTSISTAEASGNTGRLNANAGSVLYGGDFVVTPNEMTVYATHSDSTGDPEGNIALCKSTDGGITWPVCTRVNDTAYRWQYSPAVDLDSLGGLHVAWTDLRSDHRYQTYYSYSGDGAATFSANANVSSPLTENNFEQPHLVVDNSNSAVYISATRDYSQVMLARRPTTPPEAVSTPSLNGPTAGYTNTSYTYSASGASSSTGHTLQYYFDWGDGTNSGWTDSSTASHAWASASTYAVSVQARCVTDTWAVSAWSNTVNAGIAVNQAAVLSVVKTHSGTFTLGQTGATYSLTVSNANGVGPTSGTVTVTETVPAGMTLVSMNGGVTWNCAVLPHLYHQQHTERRVELSGDYGNGECGRRRDIAAGERGERVGWWISNRRCHGFNGHLYPGNHSDESARIAVQRGRRGFADRSSDGESVPGNAHDRRGHTPGRIGWDAICVYWLERFWLGIAHD